MTKLGKLYGIGVGPGDTELLTLKAVSILNSVDVIFSPRSAPRRESIARKIIEPVLNGKAEVVELVFPMTREKDRLEQHWSQAADEVASALRNGKNSAFVTLGDPFFYSTYIYLYRKLRERYPEIDIITSPGISSAFASASAAGIPIAIGDEKVVVIPLPGDVRGIQRYVEMFDTVIILKVGERLKELVEILASSGLAGNAILVQKVSQQGSEKIIFGLSGLTRDELNKVGYLSTVIVKRKLEI
ncbi:MAG: precorrin-2 C(20)-methyltransferase [Actinobacteria bacterium]|nr:precorrin-2 C(20)-methyltransferase [Actinomycetota bacterium]